MDLGPIDLFLRFPDSNLHMSESTASSSAFIEFFAECDEIIQRVSQSLQAIESAPSAEKIDSLYRDIHTLKGSSQLFGFEKIGQIAHAMEASLEPARSKGVVISSDFVDSLLKCLDLIEALTNHAKDNSQPEPNDESISSLVGKLMDIITSKFQARLQVASDQPVSMKTESMKAEASGVASPSQKLKTISDVAVPPEAHVKPVPAAPARIEKPAPVPASEIRESKMETQTIGEGASASQSGRASPAAPAGGGDSNAAESSTIRVQVSLLDRLMNLVGEMVLVRNQVLQYSNKNNDSEFVSLSQKLDLVTGELQEEVMKTRMQPVAGVLSKFHRVVRDLARDLGKQIEFAVEGAETELDKTLIEAIKDPLTHIIRNSCDHGIENPADRKNAGKPATGHINVRAYQESGQVIIEIADDGKGLDSKRILEKALEKGLINSDRAQSMSQHEIYQLIFLPGFSTAQQVSAVSGRGVGMDVVKTNIEKIGGNIELSSQLGHGTKISLKIPLTLAIVPALIVRVNKDCFAIPQIKLSELVRIERDNPVLKVDFLQGRPMIRLRGNLLQLLSLHEILGMPSPGDWGNRDINVAVLITETGHFGLIVDEILDTADIVVKPLATFFKKLQVFTGATIMGDGGVALILDIAGMANRANLMKSSKAEQNTQADLSSAKAKSDSQELLSLQLNGPGIYTVPLCLIQRLEEFPRSKIEISGNQRLVQHRNSILPIISLNDFLKLSNGHQREDENVAVLVVQKQNRTYGLEVNRILDILSVDAEVEEPIRPQIGYMGNIVTGKDVSTVLDVLTIIDVVTGADPGNAKGGRLGKTAPKTLHVLLAEDTSFFVKQITKVLTANGIKVTHAPDGEAALRILEDSAPGHFSLIVSDIEMPHLNGFQFAERVRKSQKHQNIPMIAVTTRFRDADVEQGKRSGFNKYIEKLKADQLMETIYSLMEGA